MYKIAFIDSEIEPKSKKILDLGCITDTNTQFHSTNLRNFLNILKDSEYICGHNIIHHDLKFISQSTHVDFSDNKVIDTLPLSPLLFPKKPYHSLLKDDKLQTEELNNPLNDSIKAKELFDDEINAFRKLDPDLQQIFFALLGNQREFKYFFSYVNYTPPSKDIFQTIQNRFSSLFCHQAPVKKLMEDSPIPLAYCLAIINANENEKGDSLSLTPAWVRKRFPDVDRVMHLLKNNPCFGGCSYCNQKLDAKKALKDFFGFDHYRLFGGKPLQEEAVKAAINNKSFIVVFPTGGGKSLTFQVPALLAGKNVSGLTVIISPLQSLMKDQVDNLEKEGITEAVTINGLLDPIERAKAIERVHDGSASLLYISPESLRSKTILNLLLNRNVVRFVIDEAHCFSSWGQDFRVDYLYIGDFIGELQKLKNLSSPIPVSCFTATAKQNVIMDIRQYFKDTLQLDLGTYTTTSQRPNLHYKVIPKETEEEKYNTIRNLIDGKDCPSIIYVSRTKKADKITEKLVKDGYNAKAFHGKMDTQDKISNQNAFINGDVQIMVATSAFGMGVDKKDVGMVIHYDISDSLENYVQEAGRAGRDTEIFADCYVLYNEKDLDKHFILLNQTKINIEEIKQIWKSVKALTRTRKSVSNSALEIARKAGWDDNVKEIETRVKTAIAALEEAGYLKRKLNSPRVYATSILVNNVQEATDKINASAHFSEKQKELAIRIIKNLISSKKRSEATQEDAESRVDYIADQLGIEQKKAIDIINLLCQEKILADTKDMTAYIMQEDRQNKSLSMVQTYGQIENQLLNEIDQYERILSLKELNQQMEISGIGSVNIQNIKTILNFWHIQKWITRTYDKITKTKVKILSNYPIDELKLKLENRHQLATFIIEYLFMKRKHEPSGESQKRNRTLVEFSIHEIKKQFEKQNSLFKGNVSLQDVEDTLFYLSRIESLKLEGSFLVLYNKLQIERLENNLKVKYKVEDYKKLEDFYENKTRQIHIVGEYAGKMIKDYNHALGFVNDYFQLNHTSFLNKYFNTNRQQEIQKNISPAKFKEIFAELSPTQLNTVNDKKTNYIAVAAGPGSGKTKLLVHKLASLLMMEDVKHEQLLMLTFSRAAATEFKIRLRKLIGNATHFVDIKTFHSYCFDLMAKPGDLDKSETIIQEAVKSIKKGEIEVNYITKTVLVIDESQDMDSHEFELVRTLMEKNDGLRVIAVGDDDQNIYEFRGSSSQYLERFISENKATKYELTENFRSKSNLVEFANQFVQSISHRIKSMPLYAHQKENGYIKITHHTGSNLEVALVNDILSTGLTGTTAILTTTNESALSITGLLKNKNLPARLIQSHDKFNLLHLVEIRYFIDQVKPQGNNVIIDTENWAATKRNLKEQYRESSKLELCLKIIETFEKDNPVRKYHTDLKEFLLESKLEDFVDAEGETIIVSTIHKAKGKEFDNVFLLLDGYFPKNDEKKRLLYVAMTRAKNNLSIHYKGNYLNYIQTLNLEKSVDVQEYESPSTLTFHLVHENLLLGHFTGCQLQIARLKSGDELSVDEEGCTDSNGSYVLRFSQKFREVIAQQAKRGYRLTTSKVNFIVFWLMKDKDGKVLGEYRVILPEVEFGRI